MHIINVKLIEKALDQAINIQRINADNPMSEASIEARASIKCFEFVLGLCKVQEVTGLVRNIEALELSDEDMRVLTHSARGSKIDNIIYTILSVTEDSVAIIVEQQAPTKLPYTILSLFGATEYIFKPWIKGKKLNIRAYGYDGESGIKTIPHEST